MEGWIKIHRKMIDWEWYNDNNTKVLFLHLLLTANHKDKNWQGIIIKKGQKITSLNHLAKETHLSIQQVRTSLDKLKSTNEITIKATNKYTLVNIEKYSNYQDNEEKITYKITTKKQTNNKQITTNKNDKNNIYLFLYKEYSEKISGKSFLETINVISELRERKEYQELSIEQQDDLYNKLMSM